MLRRLAGVCLGCGLVLELFWIPSKYNPADAPSRALTLAMWRAALPVASVGGVHVEPPNMVGGGWLVEQAQLQEGDKSGGSDRRR